VKTNAKATLTWIPSALRALLVGGFALIILYPLLIVLLTSFWPEGTTVLDGAILPWQKIFAGNVSPFGNYRKAWEGGQFIRAFFNSSIVALSVTVLQVLTASLAGYALARLPFYGRRVLLLVVLATLVIPFQLLVIPIFLVLKQVQLLNTLGALILPTAANGFGILLMRQFFLTIPVELEAAAALDGATRWQILWQVLLPLSRPALMTLSLFTVIGEWNDLFKPLIFTTRPELITVQLSLAGFQEQFTNNWPLMMAAVCIASLPIVLLCIVGQRQLVRGIATTGIKG
jgi:multiple sugar transport system permease protein